MRSASVQHHMFLKKFVHCKLRKSTKDSHIDLAHLHNESTVNNANHCTHINKFLILLNVVGTLWITTTGARKLFNKKASDGVHERKTTKNRSVGVPEEPHIYRPARTNSTCLKVAKG